MTEQQEDLILKLYVDHVPLSDIALQAGVSLPVVKRLLREKRRQYDIPYRRGSTQRMLNKPDPDVLASTWNVARGLEYIKRDWRTK